MINNDYVPVSVAEFLPPQPPPSATPSLGLPFFSAELEAVFRKAKCAAKRNIALAPPNPCAGNDKELPNFV